MTSTRWCYTVNNYSFKDIDELNNIDSKYHVYGKEVGESGTPHLQGFVILKKKARLSGVKKLHATAHWEIARGTSAQASEYCKKDGDFSETGVLNEQGKRTDLETACQLIKDGGAATSVAVEHPVVYVKFHRGLNALALALQKPLQVDDVRGLWFYGEPGTGKSHTAREAFPGAYLKPQSKWFDGYAGEDAIIMDDFDKGGVCLGHHLKIWSDRYACTGETKGGTVALQHKVFLVTSNWRIADLFQDADDVMIQAISRRFKEVRFWWEFEPDDAPSAPGRFVRKHDPF